MKTKKNIIAILASIACIVVVTGVFFIMESRKIDNVFDEMYLPIKYPAEGMPSFYYVPETGGLMQSPYSDYFYMGGYRAQYLRNGEHISIFLNFEKQRLLIFAAMEIENSSCLSYDYAYYFKTKTLEIKPLTIYTRDHAKLGVEAEINDAAEVDAFLREHGITREYIERYKNYFLYDKILTDWVNGNSKHSKFNIGNYGDFKLEDNIFSELGADWGYN